MEINELKDAWAQYDKKLSKVLKLNEELLRSVNLEKSTFALKKPMILELLNLVIQFCIINIIIALLIQLSGETQYFITGLIGSLMCAVSFVFSAVKASRFYDLLYYDLSVMHFQKKMTNLRILILRLRKIEYLIAVIIGITLLSLIVKAKAGIDLLGDLTVFIPAVFGVVGLGLIFGVILNLKVYDKSIKDAESFLNMVEKFGNEE